MVAIAIMITDSLEPRHEREPGFEARSLNMPWNGYEQ